MEARTANSTAAREAAQRVADRTEQLLRELREREDARKRHEQARMASPWRRALKSLLDSIASQ